MNVFIPYKHIKLTAYCFDDMRLDKQIKDCFRIIDCINSNNSLYKNHPIVQMYRDYKQWLKWYAEAMLFEQKRRHSRGYVEFDIPEPERPYFIGWSDLHRAHQARLYQKSGMLYPYFKKKADFTANNWYVVDGDILEYRDGELVKRYKYVGSSK